MQTASGQAVNDQDSGRPRVRRRRRGMRFSPMAAGVAAFLTLISLGLMVVVLLGWWPPKSTGNEAAIQVTPHTPQAVGLKIEKSGPAVRDGEDVIVHFKVTNMVLMPAPIQGTQAPDAPTPTAAPADLYNATIKVLFFKMNGDKKEIVGSGIGNVTDLAYNQTKEIQIVSTAVGDFTSYEAYPDTVTNKASIKP